MDSNLVKLLFFVKCKNCGKLRGNEMCVLKFAMRIAAWAKSEKYLNCIHKNLTHFAKKSVAILDSRV